jgi:hypothetical protein
VHSLSEHVALHHRVKSHFLKCCDERLHNRLPVMLLRVTDVNCNHCLKVEGLLAASSCCCEWVSDGLGGRRENPTTIRFAIRKAFLYVRLVQTSTTSRIETMSWARARPRCATRLLLRCLELDWRACGTAPRLKRRHLGGHGTELKELSHVLHGGGVAGFDGQSGTGRLGIGSNAASSLQ